MSKTSAQHTTLPHCPDCQVSKISEKGTTAKTPTRSKLGSIHWVLTSGTNLQANHALSGKFCDFLLTRFINGVSLDMVVELKSRPQHAKDIGRQLQAGLNLYANHTQIQSKNIRALMVFSGGMNSTELRIIQRISLNYKGKVLRIKTVSNQCDLSTIN